MPDATPAAAFDLPAEKGRHACRVAIDGRDLAGAPAATELPLVVCNGAAPGPSLLVSGGVHGDEYEGPAAIWRVANAIDAEALRGTLILAPALNPPALEARQRRGPIDDLDLNRSFPGEEGGLLTNAIAAFVAEKLAPRVDAVVDLHAGGEIEDLIPSLMVHAYDDDAMTEQAIALLDAFGAPVGVVIDESRKQGMFDTFVEDLGKLFACAELGGSGRLSPETIEIAENGVWNTLVHFDMLPSSYRRSGGAGKLCLGPAAGEITVDRAGFYEPIKTVGDHLRKGDVIARLLDLSDPLSPAQEILAPIDGVLFIQCSGGHVERGEFVGDVIIEGGDRAALTKMVRHYISNIA